MRQLRFASILASSAFVIPVPALHAQFIAGGINGIDWAGTVQKRPYTATWTEKSVQDGTWSEEFTIRYARDARGRVYQELRKIDKDGQGEALYSFVYDPIAHTVSWLNSNTKQALVIHYADSDASAILKTFSGEPRSATPFVDRGGIQGADFNAVKPEDLGTKTIAGVTAQGTRLTTPQVIRGWKPLTITVETWRSTEYGVLLQKIYSPHYDSGTTSDLWSNTLEVTDFRPGEPDAALFRVPGRLHRQGCGSVAV
jgi:hypothetical protein